VKNTDPSENYVHDAAKFWSLRRACLRFGVRLPKSRASMCFNCRVIEYSGAGELLTAQWTESA